MALEIYDQAYVSVNGKLLAEATRIESGFENNDQDVFTLRKGYAGQTPSPKKRVTNIDNVVLRTGFEGDFEKWEIDSTIVTLGIVLGGSGKTMTNTGFIRNTKITNGVGETMALSFEHHGEPKRFE